MTRNPADRVGPGPASRGESGGDFLRRLENEPPGPVAFPYNGKQARTTGRPDADPNDRYPRGTTTPLPGG